MKKEQYDITKKCRCTLLLILLLTYQRTDVTSFTCINNQIHHHGSSSRPWTKIKCRKEQGPCLNYHNNHEQQIIFHKKRKTSFYAVNQNDNGSDTDIDIGVDYDYDNNEEGEELEFEKFESTSEATNSNTSAQDETKLQIEQQQKQIDMLMQMMKNQSMQQQQQQQQTSPQSTQQSLTKKSNINGDNNNSNDDDSLILPPPLPGMFDQHQGEDELSYTDDTIPSSSISSTSSSSTVTSTNIDQNNIHATTNNSPQQEQQTSLSNDTNQQTNNNTQNDNTTTKTTPVPLAPLKVMLFIDGTWLYYSLHRRQEHRDPIVKKFGRGWQYRYRFDWNALPRIVCEQLVGQQQNLGWSATGSPELMTNDSQPNNINYQAQRPMEIVRASVFTSYKKTTDPNSFRVKMYNEMANANYDLHMLESVGNGPEKCVDISLAVEMLHYATVPNAYDVAILLSGDKDFIPALVRTRQKGRKVGIVAMRTGCNRALYESPHIKDFDVVWIDDFLDRLLVPLPPDQVDSVVESIYDRGLLSAFTITKVIYDFIAHSPFDKISSRDVGRYLKGLEIKDGTTLLDDVKLGQGGLRRFLQDRMPSVFDVTDKTAAEKFNRDSNDKSYWISIKDGATDVMLMEAKSTSFTSEEKQFLKDYQSKMGGRGDDLKEELYCYTVESTAENVNFPAASMNVHSSVTIDNDRKNLKAKEEDFSKLTVVELKDICRERNLRVSGTKAILIERIQNDIEKEEENSSETTGDEESISKYLENLVKYYITQCGGNVSSRDLGRFLATNKAYKSDSISALQQLKDIFGGVASFLNQRNHLFVTIRNQEQSFGGSSNSYSFGIKLREPGNTPNQSPRNYNTRPNHHNRQNSNAVSHSRFRDIDPNIPKHIDALIKEYLRVRGGLASSRDIGRYLAANAAFSVSENNIPWTGRKQTALQQLKENYGSLASYLSRKTDVFATVSGDLIGSDAEGLPPSQHSFGVKLK